MKLAYPLLAAVALGAAILPQRAHACGGCFTQPGQTTQVSGHRMILSVTPQQTTLWDQIEYSGNPNEFAWILPVHGTVTIGLSSDALFGFLDGLTDEVVTAPPVNCPSQFCGGFGTAASSGTSGAGGGSGGGVNVVAQQVVGPYETVQLHATDPNALANWLASHGYDLPANVKPVTDAYIAEGFDFLAMKLVPGQGVAAMRPVRITTSGASLSLPLRMVAAGTGAITPIKLWVVGEGRYQPANMPAFQIDPNAVVWDYATASSNLAALREQGFNLTSHAGWLVESSTPIGSYLFAQLVDRAQYDPAGSGYADAQGMSAVQNAQADIATLMGSMTQMRLTRLDAELSRPALANDLQLGASADQSLLSPYIYAAHTLNRPTCPPPPQCGSGSYSSGGFGGSGGAIGITPRGASGCSVATGSGIPTVALAAVALAAARRRRLRPQVRAPHKG